MGRHRNRRKQQRKQKRKQQPKTGMVHLGKVEKKMKQAKKNNHSPALSICHAHRMQNLIDFRGGQGVLWAGSLSSVRSHIDAGAFSPSLVIELVGTHYDFAQSWPIEVNAVASDTLPPGLFSKTGVDDDGPAILSIDWTDGGVPSGLDEPWWDLLADTIRNTDGDIVVLCAGGHGRTGTVLSILAAKLGVTEGDPVAWVRDKYCDHVVETKSQISYVARMTGRDIGEDPSDWSRSNWSQYDGLGGKPKTSYISPPGGAVSPGGVFYDPTTGTEGFGDDDMTVDDLFDDDDPGDLLLTGA